MKETRMSTTTSNGMNGFQVIIAITKCVVGTGSFFLPQGIAQAGLWGGVVGLILMAGVTMYINWIILSAKFKYNVDTYHELCFVVMGPIAGWLMYASVIITNVGSCSVYLVTSANLLTNVSDKLSIQEYMVIVAVIELFISWLPSFKYLAWTSFIGLAGLLTAMVSVFVYGFTNVGIQPISEYPPVIFKTYAVFFAVAAFLYIQPSTFFPIANAAAQPHLFNFYNTIAYVIIAAANTFFASIAYMFFGANTQPLVLDNICPEGVCNNSYTFIAQIALFVDIVFTFPLVLAPAHEVIESSLFFTRDDGMSMKATNESSEQNILSPSASYSQGSTSSFNSTKCKFLLEETLFRRNAIRTIVMLFTYAIAALIPKISALVGIISGVTLTFNSFIMGPLIHLTWNYERNIQTFNSLEWLFSLCTHIFLILIGTVLGGWSTYLAVISI